MTTRRLASWIVCVGVCVSIAVVGATEASAQAQTGGKQQAGTAAATGASDTTSITSVLELAVGYTVARFTESDTVTVGWSASFAARPTGYFALVSEMSGSYGERAPRVTDPRKSAIFFLNGPRVRGAVGRVTVFGDALLGIAHDRDFRDSTGDENRFVWRPGGGVDFRLSASVSVRFAVGSIFNLVSDDGRRVDQFTTAIVFGKMDPRQNTQ